MLKKNVLKKKTANALPFHLCDSQVPLKVAVSSGKSWGSMSELDVPPMFPSLWARRLPPFTSSTATPLCWICFFSPSMSSFLPLIVSSSSVPLHLSCILITMETSQLKLPLTFSPSVSGGNGRSLRLDRTSLVFFFSCSLSLSILQKKIPCPLPLLLLISSSSPPPFSHYFLRCFSGRCQGEHFMFKRGRDIYRFIKLFQVFLKKKEVVNLFISVVFYRKDFLVFIVLLPFVCVCLINLTCSCKYSRSHRLSPIFMHLFLKLICMLHFSKLFVDSCLSSPLRDKSYLEKALKQKWAAFKTFCCFNTTKLRCVQRHLCVINFTSCWLHSWLRADDLIFLCSSLAAAHLLSAHLAPAHSPLLSCFFASLSHTRTHSTNARMDTYMHARPPTPTLSIRAAEMNALAHIQRLPGTLTDFLYLWQPQLDTFYSVLQLRPFEPAKCVWQHHTPCDKINKA